ncbi:MAG: type IX secretion system sortase PorU [Ignavibacteria bacterium]|jgi:hypothetical protein|nr:type IX secretion system sortase PorU [Ignavibacteria bacterium]MCU7502220.1 type IX secretion system sortase PorU [Ignavibacteria bacterium]MCU7517437.1 type IX secretion system sortase PorU [Ignavibacteria bacterium]
MKSKYFIIFTFVLLTGINVLASQDIKVISSDTRSLTLEFSPQYTDTSTVIINNQPYKHIAFNEGEILNLQDFGMPAIPVKSFSVGVPAELGNTIQVLASDYVEIQGRVEPIKKSLYKDGMLTTADFVSEKYGQYQTNDLVSFGSYGMARNVPVQTVRVYPVQFDPAKNSIRLYKKIVIRISFASAKVTAQGNLKDDDLLKESLINYQAAKNWSVSQPRRLGKAVVNSVMSDGRWFRFEAPAEGIYKINASFLRAQGLDPALIDPKTLKIYNNGGKMLPERLDVNVADDLVENAVYLSKSVDDGKFNDDDFILFYGRGNQFFDYDTVTQKVQRYFHLFSNSNYFWLTFGKDASKKMQEVQNLKQNPDFLQTTTKAYASFEDDTHKVLNSGKLYVGDQFDETTPSRTYRTDLNNIVSGSTIKYKFNFVNRSDYSALISLQENSTLILNAYINGTGVSNLATDDYAISQVFNATYKSVLPDDKSMLKFTYKPNVGSQSAGYLNYFEIYYDMQLTAKNESILFYSVDSTGVDEFRLNGFRGSGIEVFDITDCANLKRITDSNRSGGDCSFRSIVSRSRLSKFMAVGPDAYKTPGKLTEIGNSNVHATNEAKYIIISHKNFIDQANRLKAFKESESKFRISTSVVDVDQIFNEFSCGMRDVSAIRNFIRYAYDNWTVKPEYVLLLGDGNYDYKNVLSSEESFIIPYESDNSFHNMDTYVSDDFYATVSGNDNVLDLAIGRINALTPADAKAAVDKIIDYETKSDPGLWRNLVTMVADDNYKSDGWDGAAHATQSETISTEYVPKTFDQNKIYEEFYPTVATGTGRRKPAVNQAIIKAVNDGTLILNWIGHGNPEVWSHEYIFEKSVTIPQLVNNKYFFLVAATCDFGRYDEPGVQSSTEMMLLKPDGGSIGAFTSSRTVYSLDNFALAKSFYMNLFRTDSTGYVQPVGKSYYATKMNNNAVNDLKFYLSGDPTLRLLMPVKAASIDSVNSRTLLGNVVQLKALSKAKIDGSVRKSDGSIDNSFNGQGIVSVYDSKKLVLMKEFGNQPAVYQGGLLFRGMVSVKDGLFSTEFQVPKDISYENKNGKVEAFLYSNNSENVVGYTDSIVVGGTDSTAVNDQKGPQIDITFDDASTSSSYLVKPNFALDVKLKDDSGLNTTGTGIGHKITGILNDNESSPIDLSSYFVGDLNAGGKSGTIKYNFNGLESGDYKIQVRAWDIFNNPSEAEEHFTVVDGSDLVVRDVLNYPNPFSTNTTFTFQRNMANPVDVKIKVYTVAGRMIKEIEGMGITDKFVRIDWDGRDNDGNLLANGVYLYKLIVKSVDEQYKQEVLGKLAVIR